MTQWYVQGLIIFLAAAQFMAAGAAQEQQTDRVLVIGLDGADWDVIQPLIEEGKMPHLEQLMADGKHGNLTTTLPIESPVAWTSMTTGTTPGKHGIYGFIEREDGKFVPTTADDVRVDRVWDHVGKEGEVVVMNVPQTFPPKEVNGYLVGGYLSIKDAGYTYPASLQEEIEADGYSIEALSGGFDPEKKDAFLGKLDGVVENRTRIAEQLLDRSDWTLGFVVYTGLDRVQHYFWKYQARGGSAYSNVIADHYVTLDKEIGALMEHAGENTTVMVVSDHGFGPLRKNVYVNTWLRKNGYLHLKGNEDSGGSSGGLLATLGLTQQRIVDLLSSVGLLGPVKSFFNLLGFNPGASLPAPSMSDINFDRTRVYAGNYGGKIYLTDNVPEEQREQLLDTLEQELSQITDPATGEPVFRAIHRSEDIYTGDRQGAPDLVLEEATSYRAVGFLGHRKVVKAPPKKSGTHRKEGIYVIGNAGVSGEEDAHITDITPTILDQLNLSVPGYIDGESLFN